MPFRNPVIPGFYPDPSICRVNEDYYLVTSSFDYFPGVPVFHSRDLVHWRQIGHCLTRPSQLPLDRASPSGGIYAPTLRYHAGRFYMITTNVSGYGHFYVHTDDPAGEWSEPVRVEGPHFDPDLFFDVDGKVYFSRMNMGEGIYQREIDLATGKLRGPERMVWPGFEDRYCEAPHIYRINGVYYLLVAEGGTHRGHMAVVARAASPTGPFEGCPHNPILTHRALVAVPIQATGHGDLVQAHDGSWWMVFLGIRPVGWSAYHHLGRETFLAPVTWTDDGWPVVNGGQPVGLEMDAPTLPPHPWPAPPVRDDFDGPRLGLPWNFRKNPAPGAWSLTERTGWLTLHGTPQATGDFDPPILVGRRQQRFACTVTARLDFDPQADGDEAGLTVYMTEQHHYDLGVIRAGGANRVVVRKQVGDLVVLAASVPLDGPRVQLRISAEPAHYTFAYADVEGGPFTPLATGLTRYLSSEVASTFTGVYFGMYASGNGKASAAPAAFDWFDYEAGSHE